MIKLGWGREGGPNLLGKGKSGHRHRHARGTLVIRQGEGVPAVAQQVTNPTSTHEDAGSIPGLAPWVKDLLFL